jgi:hypothetical protein
MGGVAAVRWPAAGPAREADAAVKGAAGRVARVAETVSVAARPAARVVETVSAAVRPAAKAGETASGGRPEATAADAAGRELLERALVAARAGDLREATAREAVQDADLTRAATLRSGNPGRPGADPVAIGILRGASVG